MESARDPISPPLLEHLQFLGLKLELPCTKCRSKIFLEGGYPVFRQNLRGYITLQVTLEAPSEPSCEATRESAFITYLRYHPLSLERNPSSLHLAYTRAVSRLECPKKRATVSRPPVSRHAGPAARDAKLTHRVRAYPGRFSESGGNHDSVALLPRDPARGTLSRDAVRTLLEQAEKLVRSQGVRVVECGALMHTT